MTSKKAGAAAAATAAQAIIGSQAAAVVTAPGAPSQDMPAVKFDRLSVERRVLGTINDGTHSERLGARNNLAAIADFLLSDPNTINAPPPNAKLDVAGLPLSDQVQLVLDHLDRLIDAGLVERDGELDDPEHTYSVTEAGAQELSS